MNEKDRLIHVRVNDGNTEEEWTDYALTEDAFRYIEPILQESEEKTEMRIVEHSEEEFEEVKRRKENPIKDLIPALILSQAQNNGKDKPKVIYNVREKPKNYTEMEIIRLFRETGILLVDSKKIHTQRLE